MSEKHLHEVVDEIKFLIDQGKANDALPLTHLLLSHYPRYIQGYQLLAEIALEEGSTADAIEVLQRILSADPESFVAHAGLAVAFKNQEQAEDALWHIQRAFEMEPRLREVREEVRQISQLHTGHRPGRLHLNGAALSRMYMREGTYDQAVKQLKGELETQKNRVDLQVALAEAQWFAQRHSDAVRTSRQVLQELPLCLKINLILGQFYAQQEDFGQAERFLHVVQQLDPANELSAAWFGKAGYLQPRDVIIPLNDDGRQNRNQAKMPRWLSNLSLFAAHDTEAQQESPAVTSIDDSFEFSGSAKSGFVDATPIDEADATPVISIDSDFDFDVSAEPADSTETLEPEPVSDWTEQIGTDRGLIEPHFIDEPLDPPPSALRPASKPPSPPSISAQAAWREALRAETWNALNQLPALEPPSTEADMTSQADWLARLRAQTEAALVEHQRQTPTHVIEQERRDDANSSGPPETTEVVTTSDHVIDWKEKLSAATHAALVERETKQLMGVAEPSFAPFIDDAPAEMDWRHGLIAATHAALADYEAAQSEDVTPVDSVGTLQWRQQLRRATDAALAEHDEAAQSEDVTPVDSVGTLQWRQQLRRATHAALVEHEAQPDEDVAPSALSSEEIARAALDEPAHAAWKDALKVETEAYLASWTAPSALEQLQIELEKAIDQVTTPVTSRADLDEPVGGLEPPQLLFTEELPPAPKARRRVGKRWIEGLRFDTEVWLTTRRRTQRESELELEKTVVEPPSALILAEEELAITPPPLASEPALALTEETTVEAEPPELTTLPSQIEPEEAVRPWVTSLRLQTEEELAPEATWIAQLDQASQAELAALGTPPATWVAGLRAETDTYLAETTEISSADSREDPSAALRTSFSRSEQPKTSEVVTTSITDEVSSAHSRDGARSSELPETSEVVTTPEIDEDSEFVFQVEEEASQVVTTQEVEQETSDEISFGESSDGPSAALRASFRSSELPKTSEVVTTPEIDEDSEFVFQVEEEASQVVTTPEVGEASEFVAQVDEETTEVVTTPEVGEETPQVVTTPEVDEETPQVVTRPEVGEASEFVAQVEEKTAKETTEVVTTPEVDEETTEVVTTPEVGEEATEVVTTPEVDEEASQVVTTPEVGEKTSQVVTTSDVDESSKLVTDVASEISSLSPSYTNGTVTSKPILPDRWQLARQAWQVGKHQDAYAIYHTFFSESDEHDAQLDDALSAWTRIDDAPFLAFQLLGDVYRRMRRMQDAVRQYREAIKRI